ncbi:MAG: EFR1 family ferrodoxin [Spirochaetales bacterium]|uniref:EFR1 family ferrodoxin n=1 Tax=Candidatus Thalassospirochaeta sargassi TaxID=3119039 RepID=A0AAJ1IF33_9SPIO|nr:EFR1 family ferrodoxin [Spirochaetales bacterium]
MKKYNIKAVFFSPTGNTEKIVTKIAEEIAASFDDEIETINFTLPEARRTRWVFDVNTIVVFGLPVYAGRIPNKTLPAVKENFAGNGAFAIPVVTFGNRSYDDALSELRDLLEANDFRTIAGAAVVGRHPFSDVLASGRPDADDIDRLKGFSQDICYKLGKYNMHRQIEVKGVSPAKEYYCPKGVNGEATNFLKAKPKTNKVKCTKCKICARVCPMGSIDSTDVSLVSGVCIKCHACVLSCPVNAKYFDDPAFLSHVAMLDSEYVRRVESDFFV